MKNSFKMKKLFLLPFSLFFCQCFSPIKQKQVKFISLKQEKSKKSKIFTCSIKPIDEDIHLSHYKIFGLACKNNVEHNILKVALGKRGNSLDYAISLSPNEAIRASDIYMTETEKEKFAEGKTCKFRIKLDNLEKEPRFMIKNGNITAYIDEGQQKNTDDEILVSIFIEHENLGKIHKSSAEITFHE